MKTNKHIDESNFYFFILETYKNNKLTLIHWTRDATVYADTYGHDLKRLHTKMASKGSKYYIKIPIPASITTPAAGKTPEEAAKQAVENDVHVLGVSSLAAGHRTHVPQLFNALAQHKREDISVIVGGVIPVQDHEFLIKSGVLGIYGPGTKISKAAVEILNLLLKKYTN